METGCQDFVIILCQTVAMREICLHSLSLTQIDSLCCTQLKREEAEYGS